MPILAGCVLTACVTLSAGALWVSPLGSKLDVWLLSQFFSHRGQRNADAPVVIVAVDDESYEKLGASPRWPFPIKHIASALEKITSAKPRSIWIESQLLRDGPADAPETVARIRQSLIQAPNIIWKNGEEGSNLLSTLEANTSSQTEVIRLPALSQDTVVSKLLPLKGQPHPFEKSLRINLEHSPSAGALINYYGPRSNALRIGLFSVLEMGSDSLRENFENKIIFLGYQGVVRQRGQIARDDFMIPLGADRSAFAVEIYATSAANLMAQNWIERLSALQELTLVLFGSFILSALGIFMIPIRSVPLLMALLGATTVYAFHLFSEPLHPFWLGGLAILALASIAAILTRSSYHAVTIRRQNEKLRTTYRVDI